MKMIRDDMILSGEKKVLLANNCTEKKKKDAPSILYFSPGKQLWFDEITCEWVYRTSVYKTIIETTAPRIGDNRWKKQSSKSIFSRPYFDRCDLGPESKRSSIKKKKMIRASARQSKSVLRVFYTEEEQANNTWSLLIEEFPLCVFLIIFNFVATWFFFYFSMSQVNQ